MKVHGIGVSPGVAIGKAFVFSREKVRIEIIKIPQDQVEAEILRFEQALSKSISQLEAVKTQFSSRIGASHASILDSHIMMLKDKMLTEGTHEIIRKDLIAAEGALKKVLDEFFSAFESIEDNYLKERSSDVVHVGERILHNLSGHAPMSLSSLKEDVIVIAHDLTPADTMQMGREHVKGFATDLGGKTSHTGIMARSLDIPAVVGIGNITACVKSGDPIILDGGSGAVVIHPDNETFNRYLEKQRRYIYFEKELQKLTHLPAETSDGCRVRLSANIETPDDVCSVLEHGADGVGLYRTEFLFLNRPDLPGEEEQFQAYKSTLEMIYPEAMTIRTLDLGGDKLSMQIPYSRESNPSMGLRAIRFCLAHQDIFKTQLRALARAGVYGNLRILLPLISGVMELRTAKNIFHEVLEDLRREGVEFKENIPLGAMIEVPSAAIVADMIAREVDFLSIGTNDLIQYTLAIDRVNEHVAYLYEPLHPAVMRMIKYVISVAMDAKIPVAMCGEVAGDPTYAPALLGLGLREFSMNPVSVPRVKRIILSVSLEESKRLANEILKFSTAREIEEYTKAHMRSRFPEEFEWDANSET
ncbi:MAG: phosphoenolpyruvate--protein phosphotransferase [Nitrospirae bacterium CG_4_9_14_3_um_filter_53_35]|nr:MAG: phosphoenolpyruvate--protein phosphotransferase [Nitrospirae bacterium CG2_30_53_67]PIS36464.1 MAG: phosphoenolpyruvate--protein phosphotransferase [Nitrospirae bacterium CG08_land_8_20_14_0_20_52_24]PIW85606.1 MAG: phosphoenolpyruvate--protein phosphotransferase [Nitrospirae bacterium CG_4_8_14_3_um_filter_50_41]PIX84684.1 MAG: phosphoenolpyruvate--protein phosphotransferase [Nitrospirae bacterium CG_4_10_14_3_um_filter_53_41]PJA75009.1 MAG: phosphoenolpyruvate--protein phosphotransfer